jgi:NADH-quinone oxidoreductase subunit J
LKLVALLIAIGVVLGISAPAIVHAQPAGTVQVQHIGPAPIAHPHDDIIESHSKPMALLFWVFAFASIGGALFVITRRNLITAVMGMVGSFIGIAAIYMMLYAQFLAVIQMLVYAGAIMVLFVFCIMILNRPEDEPVAPTGRFGGLLGGISIIYLIARLAQILINVVPPDKVKSFAAPAAITLAPYGTTPAEAVGWGTVKAVGNDLFGPGLFPFEAISILLLVAVVGAIAIARPLHPHDGTDADPGTHP